MSFWCLQFPPKNERKQVNLRFHSSDVKFVLLFFGGKVGLKNRFNFVRPIGYGSKRVVLVFATLSSLYFDFNLKIEIEIFEVI